MSLWQFMACVEGWNRANGSEEKPQAMSDTEFEALVESVDNTYG
jgi:hypothetical protein